MVEIEQMLVADGLTEDAHLILQVHDELVFEIRASRAEEIGRKIQSLMEHVVPDDQTNGIPLLAQAKVGPDWGTLTPLT